ncbi:MAG: formate dehydrogenase accessory sulfurtransferase FdhD [Methylibium sp.]|uniref:formate dehydrogenase accessory sulfurtransferase FdhD n=1 Tax=Methylibium sp. TaxID=2067992 RepID=UPI0018379A16|nr:formate dehydrogenase accessory sulfurtransferase FdhD [Methylibium sp.]MBA3597543.1 formate dehydrogenase accessory sulfurtransferase FdhD [Methylibium sp.]
MSAELHGSIASPLVCLPRLRSQDGGALVADQRTVPEETAIAFVYDGAPHAVMMATPADLEDFALGFSLSEAVIDVPAQIAALEICPTPLGIELRMQLAARSDKACTKRHRLTGPSGCGLCGVETLDAASKPVRWLRDEGARWRCSPDDIAQAMQALGDAQALNREARALHAAGFWRPGAGLVALREDVGRHNALDKLAGALAQRRTAGASGMVLLTSRISVELVQKTARLGAPMIAAVSAPTALAVRTAHACGITLVALARGRDFEVYSHADRIDDDPAGATRERRLPITGSTERPSGSAPFPSCSGASQ